MISKMPYKEIKFLGINFKIAEKGNWIKFTDKEIQDFLTSFKITKDDLVKSHKIEDLGESKEIIKEIKIPSTTLIPYIIEGGQV